MKAKAANRLCFMLARENAALLEKHNTSMRYNENDLFYIKLGIELASANLATLVGANNAKALTTEDKVYVHSVRRKKNA